MAPYSTEELNYKTLLSYYQWIKIGLTTILLKRNQNLHESLVLNQATIYDVAQILQAVIGQILAYTHYKKAKLKLLPDAASQLHLFL
ncbi:MAG: hypothetical protein VXW87_03435 [Pseudomonadota bacterium]|nr:hypothetical protein [Pseudomonadota bacterium]